MNNDFIESIQSRGYWRVNIRPSSRPDDELPLSACRSIVEQARVSLRGWDYPHIPRRMGNDQNIERHDNYVQAWTDWSGYREFWRMYTSGQFLHYRALNEDWRELDVWGGTPPRAWGQTLDGRVLGVMTNLWLITEIFEFVSRLVQSNRTYHPGLTLSLTLHSGDEPRQLWIEDNMRVPFSYERTTNARTVKYDVVLSAQQASDPKAQAEKAAIHFFERFNWDPALDQLRADMDKLYHL